MHRLRKKGLNIELNIYVKKSVRKRKHIHTLQKKKKTVEERYVGLMK